MTLDALTQLPLVRLPPGEILITQGVPVSALYFLVEGEVEVLKDDVTVADVREPGAVFGEMSWLLETVPSATVRTVAPSAFRRLEDPATFLRAHPEITLHMAAILARRIDSLTRYVVEIRNQFRDRADHLGIIDEVMDALMHKHPRRLPRRENGD